MIAAKTFHALRWVLRFGIETAALLVTVAYSRPRIDVDLHVILVLPPDCSDA